MQSSASRIWESATTQQLSQTLAAIKDVPTMQNFLRDVMTEKEIIEISARLEAARMLQEGARYTEIIKKTKLSSRTIARISDWLKTGFGGYEVALKNIHHSHTPPVSAE